MNNPAARPPRKIINPCPAVFLLILILFFEISINYLLNSKFTVKNTNEYQMDSIVESFQNLNLLTIAIKMQIYIVQKILCQLTMV